MKILKLLSATNVVALSTSPLATTVSNAFCKSQSDWKPDTSLEISIINKSSNVDLDFSSRANLWVYNEWHVAKWDCGWGFNESQKDEPDIYSPYCKLSTLPLAGTDNNLVLKCSVLEIKKAIESDDHIIQNASIDIPNLTNYNSWLSVAQQCTTYESTAYRTSNFGVSADANRSSFWDSCSNSNDYSKNYYQNVIE